MIQLNYSLKLCLEKKKSSKSIKQESEKLISISSDIMATINFQ